VLRFLKKLKEIFQTKQNIVKEDIISTYNSLSELPIHNWWKLNETGDYGYLYKEYREVKDIEPLEVLRTKLVDELIENRGISKTFKTILSKEIEIARLQNELVITGDRINNTFINIAKEELRLLNQNQTKEDNIAMQAYVDSGMGFQVITETTSVLKFYAYIDLINAKNQTA